MPLSTFKQSLRWLSKSYAALSFLLLICISAGCQATQTWWHFDPYSSAARTWIWWTVRDFRQRHTAPNIVLLGSSLLVAAKHGADALYLHAPQDLATNHRCAYLESLLTDRFGTSVTTFAFAVGGQMASDAYLIASSLLNQHEQPNAIIYCIAPRDLLDDSLTDPRGTETYSYIKRLTDLSRISGLIPTNFWQAMNNSLEQVLFIYRFRDDFTALQHRIVKSMLASCLKMHDLDEVHAPFLLRKLAVVQLHLAEDHGIGEHVVAADARSTAIWVDNRDEYRMRYQPFKPKVFNTQMAFLDKLMIFTHRNGIKLILVNMPLTPENIALMPTGVYKLYLSNLTSSARRYQAQLIDLNQPGWFKHTDFSDSAHLNHIGGKKLFELLANRLGTSTQLAITNGGMTK